MADLSTDTDVSPTMCTKGDEDVGEVLFITLPNELIDRITSHLGPSDLLKLRLILPKGYNDLLMRLLQPALVRLYVAPTKPSMSSFTAICESEFFRHHVKEVFFLPEMLQHRHNRDASEKDFAELLIARRRKTKNRIGKIAGREWSKSIFDSLLERYAPSVPDENGDHIFTFNNDIHNAAFDDMILKLTDGLQCLPQLGGVAARLCDDSIGLKASSSCTAGCHVTHRVLSKRHVPTPHIEASIARNFFFKVNGFENLTNAFLKAVACREPSLQKLEVGGISPHQLPARPRRRWYLQGDMFLALAKQLTTITIGCPDGKLPAPWTRELHGAGTNRYGWYNFFKLAICLQHLKLYAGQALTDDEYARQNPSTEDLISFALDCSQMPSLKTVEIIGDIQKPTAIFRKSLVGFLQSHTTSLEEIKMTGVIVVNKSDLHDAPNTIWSVLNYLRGFENLTDCSMLIQRRDRHAESGCRSGICGKYSVAPHVFVDRAEFDKLAEALGVELKDGVWDFGEYVMRFKGLIGEETL